MNKNKQTIIGLVIIGLILLGFSLFQNYQQKQAAKAAAALTELQRVEDSIALANSPRPVADTVPDATTETRPTATPAPQNDPLGETLAAARAGAPETFSIDNDVMSIEFSTLGGIVSDVMLKDYKRYDGDSLHLWREGSELFDVGFFIKAGYNDAQINTRNFNFEWDIPAGTSWAQGEEAKIVSMRLPVAQTDSLGTPREAYVEFVYNIPRADYMLSLSVNFIGMEPLLSNQSSFSIDWANTGLQNEKGFDNENNYTTISYRYPDKNSIEDLGIAGAGKSKDENETGKVQWVAFKQQFFSSVLIAADNFQGADMSYTTLEKGSGAVKNFKARLTVPMERGKENYAFNLYFGPNKFSQLKKYNLQMERVVPLGGSVIGWISRLVVIPLFDWLGSKGLAFGWIILIMTFIIKVVIFPLTFTSYKSSAKMRVIKPETDEINARFPGKEDAVKKQQATMELYRRAGINPLMGCIPMLIQFPIIIAMFRFFPAAIELRGERLWWADDLSSYDSILNIGFNIPFYGDHISLFALLMAVSMFVYSWLNFRQQAAAPQMAGMKFMMLYLMPIMLLFWFNNYAAGLCFYYLLSNLFTIAQMYGARLFINETKLRKKMLETPRKEKKKSGFMARLEEMQRQQQQGQRAVRDQQSSGKGAGKKKR